MKKVSVNYFAVLILLFLIAWNFLPEIHFFAMSLLTNGITSPHIFKQKLVLTTNQYYKTEIEIDGNEYDLSKSYLRLSGSKIIQKENYKDYISFLDRYMPFAQIYLNQSDVKNINGKLNIQDNTKINREFTIMEELILVDYQGKAHYDWRFYSISKDFPMYVLNRTSYLIQYIIMLFALFGLFIKTNIWASVFDSKTKKTLSGAIARFYIDQRLVNTFITSVNGILNVKLKKGKYKIEVLKAGYTFPSKLSPMHDDGIYKNLYYGGIINITKDNSRLKLNIPLDPDGEVVNKTPSQVISSFALTTISDFNPIFLGIIISTLVIMWPLYLETWVFVFVSLILFLIKYLLVKSSKPLLGRVVDRENNPVPHLKLNVFDFEWDKIAASTTTDEKGEYEILLLPNEYYLKIGNPQWKIANTDSSAKHKLVGKTYEQVMHINDIITVEPVQTN